MDKLAVIHCIEASSSQFGPASRARDFALVRVLPRSPLHGSRGQLRTLRRREGDRVNVGGMKMSEHGTGERKEQTFKTGVEGITFVMHLLWNS